MKCYTDSDHLLSCEKSFNYGLIRTRRVVEQTFGRLKGRFRVLEHNSFRDPHYLAKTTAVCCALHNVCDRWQCPKSQRWTINKTLYHPHRNDRINNQMVDNAAEIQRVLAERVHQLNPKSASRKSPSILSCVLKLELLTNNTFCPLIVLHCLLCCVVCFSFHLIKVHCNISTSTFMVKD